MTAIIKCYELFVGVYHLSISLDIPEVGMLTLNMLSRYIWFNNVRSSHACVNDDMLIEKAKHYGGELNLTGLSYFVEKYCFVLTNLKIRNFFQQPKGLDYRDTTVTLNE